MSRNPDIVAKENDKIAELEAAEQETEEETVEVEEVEETEEVLDEETPEPDAVTVFGETITKEEWEEHKKAKENISGLVASYTRKFQDLSDQRKELDEFKGKVNERLQEVEHIRTLAQSAGPEAVHAYLSGEELEPGADQALALKKIQEKLDRLERGNQTSARNAALNEVRAGVLAELQSNDILKTDADSFVNLVQNELFAASGVDVNNWRDKVKEIVTEKATAQESRDRARLERHLKAKAKGKAATVPRSAGASAPKPTGTKEKRTKWAEGMKNIQIDTDDLTRRAEKFMQEYERGG
jgi:hypothetical protein